MDFLECDKSPESVCLLVITSLGCLSVLRGHMRIIAWMQWISFYLYFLLHVLYSCCREDSLHTKALIEQSQTSKQTNKHTDKQNNTEQNKKE